MYIWTFPLLSHTVPEFCDCESTVTSAGNYTWPMSASGAVVSLSCVFGPVDDSSTGTATRECGPKGSWMDPDLSQCRNISRFNAIINKTVSFYIIMHVIFIRICLAYIHTDHSREL